MTNTATKLKRALCSMVVMLALMAGISAIPAYAASPGIYTATATSHYRHPTTGVIEDSGGEGSYVLGQSMTDSALNKAALVEVDSSGATWVTIRLNLMDNIQSPQFQVDGSSVSATLMQEDYTNNTADYRMRVNSENSIIRCNMYVIPMGREVIFYITVGNLQSGSGDFVTSITVQEPEPEPEPVKKEEPALSPEVQAIIDDGKRAIKEMGRLYTSIKNNDIRRRINELMRISDKIVQDAVSDPSDVPQIRKFLDYYLPTTIKLLNAYDRMSDQGIEGENLSKSMSSIEDMLDTAIEAFKKQLDSLFANQALDIETDISVMNQMLAREGLSDDDADVIIKTARSGNSD